MSRKLAAEMKPLSGEAHSCSIEQALSLLQAVSDVDRLHRDRSSHLLIEKASTLLRAVTDVDKHRREHCRRSTPGFNVFETLKVFDREVVHSAFLAFLLDPAASHAQGTLFLRSFIERFLSSFEVAAFVPEHVTVRKEYTTPNGRMDVAIFIRNIATICIENKLDAGDQKDQLRRYQRYLATLKHSPVKVVLFLSKGRESNTHDPSGSVPVVTMNYRELSKWLLTFESRIESDKLLATVSMYADSCRSISREPDVSE